MELFRLINNEALDEDKKAQREVIEREKKQVALFDTPVKATKQLSKQNITTLNKLIQDFQNSLEKITAEYYKKDFDLTSSGDVPYKYNLIATELDKLDYPLLSQDDRLKITNALELVKPKLIQLKGQAEHSRYVDLDLINQIVNNFQNKLFLPIGVSGIKEIPSNEEFKNYLTDSKYYIDTATNLSSSMADKRKSKKIDTFIKKLKDIYDTAKDTKKTNKYLKIFKKFFDDNKDIINEIELYDLPPPLFDTQTGENVADENVADENDDKFFDTETGEIGENVEDENYADIFGNGRRKRYY